MYNIEIIEENEPLGTGGAILSTRANTPLSDPFLVMNGDVLFHMDAGSLVAAARRTGAALTSIHVADAGRFGGLSLRGDRVEAFQEKNADAKAGPISAGLYAFTHAALAQFENRPCSFEHDIAPVLARAGQLAAIHADGRSWISARRNHSAMPTASCVQPYNFKNLRACPGKIISA